MTADGCVTVAMSQLDRFDGFGHEPIWLTLIKMLLPMPLSMPICKRLVCHEQIVTDQLDLAADLVGEQFPTVPIVFAATIFDRADGVLGCPFAQQCRPFPRA